MLSINPFTKTDEEYAGAVAIWNAAWPDYLETVEQWREWDATRNPERFRERLMVRDDAEVIAVLEWGEHNWAWQPDKYFWDFTTHPDHDTLENREQFYQHLMARIDERNPAKLTTDTRSDKTAMMQFIDAKGYELMQTEPDSRLDVTQFDPAPWAKLLEKVQSRGVQIYSLAQIQAMDANWKRRMYDLTWAVIKDIPSPDGQTREPWEVFEKRCDNPVLIDPHTRFVAVDTTIPSDNGDAGIGAYVGLSNFEVNKVNPVLGHTGVTGVVRSHRRKGIATALKVRALSHAKVLGVTSIDTGNDENNPMLDLNVRLGFKPGPAWLSYQKVLREST